MSLVKLKNGSRAWKCDRCGVKMFPDSEVRQKWTVRQGRETAHFCDVCAEGTKGRDPNEPRDPLTGLPFDKPSGKEAGQ